MSEYVLKKDLFDFYMKWFERCFKEYKEIVSRGDIFENKKKYEECSDLCRLFHNQLHGLVLFFEKAGVLNWDELSRELKKIDEAFNVFELIDLYYGKEEV